MQRAGGHFCLRLFQVFSYFETLISEEILIYAISRFGLL